MRIRKVSEDSFFGKAFMALVAIVIVLAVFAPQYITLAVNLFVFLVVDHIYGMIVGALIGAFLSPKVTIAGIPIFAIVCAFVQYLLFH